MSNSLQVLITKKELSYILNKARLNFFEYIYYKSEYLYYEVIPIKIFGITVKKELKKLSKNKSELVYNKTGFKETLDKTDLRDIRSYFLSQGDMTREIFGWVGRDIPIQVNNCIIFGSQ